MLRKVQLLSDQTPLPLLPLHQPAQDPLAPLLPHAKQVHLICQGTGGEGAKVVQEVAWPVNPGTAGLLCLALLCASSVCKVTILAWRRLSVLDYTSLLEVASILPQQV